MRADYQNAINEDFNVKNGQGVDINAKSDDRLKENYTCKDQKWNTDKFQGDLYMSVPNQTHDLIVNHHNNPQNQDYMLPETKYPGVSGYFTNEDTASKHFEDTGKFDSIGLGHTLQQSPYYDKEAAFEARINNNTYSPEYNGHLDCFRINEEKMQEHFGTTDFYAAMAHCKENTAWGEGGGFQGYNPYINEMINKGALEYVPEKSRTCSNNACVDYAERKSQASEEAKAVNDYIEKNHIKGKDGERLGYNELSQRMNQDENNKYAIDGPKDSDINKVVDGGGNHAPPELSSNKRGRLEPAPEENFSKQVRPSLKNLEPMPEGENKNNRMQDTSLNCDKGPVFSGNKGMGM